MPAPAPEPEIEDEIPEVEETEDRGDDLPDDEPEEDRGDVVSEPETTEAKTSTDIEDEPDTSGEIEESEEAATEGSGSDEKSEPPPTSIPKSRFDEVNNKRHEAEEKIREMETQLAVMADRQKREQEVKAKEPEPEPFDYAAKDQEYRDAILDGDNSAADTIMKEMRAADQSARDSDRESILAEARKIVQDSGTQTREDQDFESAANNLISDYAEFQKENESFDQARLDEVIDLKDAFILSGMTAAQALSKAAGITMRGVSKIGATTQEAPTKKTTDVKKNLKTAKAQPPTADVGDSNGSTSDFPDISKMTDAELDALPASKLAEMRGDFM